MEVKNDEKNKINFVEILAIYLAERSVRKSVPSFLHKVEKPKDIEKIMEEIYENSNSSK